MLAPRPPQPVGPRREVAAMVVAHKQAAPIAPGHVIEIPDKPAPGPGDPRDPRDLHPGLERPLSRDAHDTPV